MDDRVVPLVAVVTLPLALLAVLFGEATLAAVVVVVGWFLLTPGLAVLADDERVSGSDWGAAGAEHENERDPIEELRERYARGELTDEEFERRVERLLETEDVDADSEPDAVTWAREREHDGDAGDERDPDDREPEPGVE